MRKNAFVFLIAIFLLSCSKKGGGDGVNQPPGAFTVSIGSSTDKSAVLNWTESKDPEGGAVTYSITLSGQTVASNVNGTTYSLTGLTKNNNYSGIVTASDPSGNKNQASFSFTTSDSPSPSDFSLTPGTITNKSIAISWTVSTLPGGGLVSYDVYLNGILKLPNLTTTAAILEGLTPNTDQTIKVVAKSQDGKTTEKSVVLKTKVNTAPGNFTITLTSYGFSFASLASNLAVDADGDTLSYYLSKNGNLLGPIVVNPTTNFNYIANALASATTYSLAIVAVDQFGAQVTSNTVSVTTKTAPEDNFIVSAKRSGSDVEVEWIANSLERFDIPASDYEIDGVKQSLFNIQVNILPLPNNQLYVKLIIPGSRFTANKISNVKVNLNWGANETPTKSQINQFEYYTYSAGTATVSQAIVKSYSNGTYGVVINFTNDIISSLNTWNIEQIKLASAVSTGTITFTSGGGNIVYSAGGSITQAEYLYLKNYSDGYILVKDANGYHRMNFTYTVL